MIKRVLLDIFFSLEESLFLGAKKKPIVALSTTEAEYIATSSTSTQAIWMERLFEDLGMKVNKPIKVYCDNQSTISMTKNLVFHSRRKHIDI
jgi:hypothetical protein